MILQDFIESLKAEIVVQAPRIVQTQAQTALALVTLRIQRDGLPGRTYSTTPVPGFFFYKRAFNAGGRTYAKQKTGTYSGFRAALGLPNGYVTLTLTGRMFRSLTTIYAGFSGTVYQARIVASDAEAAAVVGYNMDRYGDFLAPNASEAAEIAQYGQDELARIINRFFNQAA